MNGTFTSYAAGLMMPAGQARQKRTTRRARDVMMAPGGRLVLADLFSALLLPTLLAGRRGKARTRRRAVHLLTAAGLRSPQWHHLYAVIIQAVTATK
jgi:hypothetical protein